MVVVGEVECNVLDEEEGEGEERVVSMEEKQLGCEMKIFVM